MKQVDVETGAAPPDLGRIYVGAYLDGWLAACETLRDLGMSHNLLTAVEKVGERLAAGAGKAREGAE